MSEIPSYALPAAMAARDRAKARAARGKGSAIAKLPADALLSELSADQRAGLAVALERDAATANKRAHQDAIAKARADERARCIAVMSSEAISGRTAVAAKLLANDKLDAAEIVSILEASAPEAGKDSGAEMREVLAEIAEREGHAQAERQVGGKASIWDRAHARIAGEIGR